ncbi:hypothetical protein F4W70_21135 [Pseudomonas cannabina]|nr:hypothetical protein F4W70_21135 [Pseudomonas cannabina]
MVFIGNVQFEHAFRFVTKAYGAILPTVHTSRTVDRTVVAAPYRKREVRAIMATVCDHACRTELHSRAPGALPFRKVVMPC